MVKPCHVLFFLPSLGKSATGGVETEIFQFQPLRKTALKQRNRRGLAGDRL